MNNCYLYIRIWENKMIIRDIEAHREVVELAETPFTTRRLLIGNMIPAGKTLCTGVKRLFAPIPLWWHILPPNYVVIVHPKSMLEDGLSSVESKAFRDLTQFIIPKRKKVMAYVCSHPDDLTDEFILELMLNDSKFFGSNKKNKSKIIN
ncbi:hypothetical protein [Proteus penneri]|uniref:hypothetical protein n=1 Tax=Proteus penneri TaxID=102862 RepID=UPI0034D39A20